MNKSHLKLIMELIFIFLLPLLFICFTSEIQIERNFEYDNNGNYETSADIKKLTFDNSIIKYTDGYKNIINNFNLWDEQWELGVYNFNTGNKAYNSNYIRNVNKIPVNPSTTYYWLRPSGDCLVLYYDINQDLISYSGATNIVTPNNCYYLCFYIEGTTYNYDMCLNLSVSWANGNYVPYGKPLIIYTQTDVSGQNNINYTIWGNIKNLLINNLDLNNNVLIDIILCYTMLWFIMFVIWHFLYLFFDGLVHIFIDWGSKERKKVS